MLSPSDGHDDEQPNGWVVAERSADTLSWLGMDERVVCSREGEGWLTYVQPRGELGTAHRIPLTDGPTSEDRAASAARAYMDMNRGEE